MFLKCTEQYFFSNPTNMQFCVDRGVEVTLVHQSRKTQDKDLDNGYNMFGVNSHIPR